MVFCRELAVEADETGCRGRELLSGGDVLGGGEDMIAVRLELFLGLSDSLVVFPLGDWCVGVRDPEVLVWLAGGVERPAGLHGLSSVL